LTSNVAVIPAALVPIVARLDGRHTLRDIVGEVADGDAGAVLGIVERIVADLERALFLDSPRSRAEKRRTKREFARAELRKAAHAGQAYPADPKELRAFIRKECLGVAAVPEAHEGALRALVAPHIDPWRGKVGYGHAYAMLERGLGAEIDTFILFGTAHAPMRQPFALCKKAFDTPLGRLEPDVETIDAVARAAPFNVYADLLNHKREHSLEFQAVFVRAIVGDRPVKIVPILCGSDRVRGDKVEGFLRALGARYRRRSGRTVIIAGADLSHVGPRFGDSAPYDAAARERLERADRASLEHAARVAPQDFFDHVSADMQERRVCGLGPIYALLRLLPKGTRGRIAHYEQTVDSDDGSIVSHAAVGFYG
jgi:hypothetical protein